VGRAAGEVSDAKKIKLAVGMSTRIESIHSALFLEDSIMGALFLLGHFFVLLVFIGFLCFLLPGIFYILTLQKALRKCAPSSVTLEPGLIWLYLVPFVNIIFHFFIVLGMAKSLGNEFRRRGVVAEPEPGKALGLTMCICACGFMIPILGQLALLGHLVLWIVYWVKIADYSRMLDVMPVAVSPTL
jgi:hypothetical protein